jgi:hypothetical protein
MVCLTRDGKEVTCVDAADGKDAIVQACKLLLSQPDFRIGDSLVSVAI